MRFLFQGWDRSSSEVNSPAVLGIGRPLALLDASLLLSSMMAGSGKTYKFRGTMFVPVLVSKCLVLPRNGAVAEPSDTREQEVSPGSKLTAFSLFATGMVELWRGNVVS